MGPFRSTAQAQVELKPEWNAKEEEIGSHGHNGMQRKPVKNY